MKNLFKSIAGAGAALALSVGVAFAATTLVVTPTNTQGWVFNPDPVNATPYEFNENQASIGNGSLNVLPIGADPASKFIAVKSLNTLVSDVNSFSYDFLIAGNGTAADADQYYLNVYTNLPGSTTFYDCRFDYVPTTGSTTSFTTATFNATGTPTSIGDRALDGFTCPSTLAGMPTGSTVSNIALNVGDTSINDLGLAGYLDKVVVNLVSGETIYDFELLNAPSTKAECKDGGWQFLTDGNGDSFENQGDCVSYFNQTN